MFTTSAGTRVTASVEVAQKLGWKPDAPAKSEQAEPKTRRTRAKQQ